MSPTGPAPRACPEWEPLLVEDASGALPPEASRRLAVHAAGCPGCRAEAALLDEVLSLAALPPPPAAEQRLVAGGAGDALARWKVGRRRARVASSFAAAFAVAAAAVIVAASPGLLRKAPLAAGEAVWTLPDLDAVWDAAGLATLAADPAAAGTAAAPGGPEEDAADAAAAFADELVAELDDAGIYEE
jgi:hypothetical protein